MRKTAFCLAFSGMALSGCSSGQVEPPQDVTEAAHFCMAAKALTLIDATGRKKGDPFPISLQAQIFAYPAIAASRAPHFNLEFDIVDEQKVIEYRRQIEGSDYAGAAAHCDEMFGISGDLALPTLPQDEVGALFSCVAMSETLDAFLSEQRTDSEGSSEKSREFRRRLEAKLLAATGHDLNQISADDAAVRTRMQDGFRYGLSQGNMITYLAACDARFKDR